MREWSPLHYAAYYDHPYLVRCLLKYQSSKSKKGERDAIDKLPLDVAMEFSSRNAEQILRGGRDDHIPQITLDDLEHNKEEDVLAAFSKSDAPRALPSMYVTTMQMRSTTTHLESLFS